ncbi:PH domain-containing protein [Nocardia blacklockiae]|uniref:PH domain-containing protein n=1 Tax=Nocardia blacklockiae TaxID=480036 RepID=UPI0018943343|nr:PH domain-containing protein [Nocardia blacklockiae]MBF6172460.1 PH domain-containing protein [Nocardia blacklockiae]
MGYPEELLAPEERVLLHRHPHWKMLFWPAVTLIAATAVAGFAGGFAWRNTEGTTRDVVLLVIVAVWAALLLWRCAAPVLRWRSTHFIITDRRVLVREGVLTHTGIDIPMNRIANIQFRHGLSDRLLGTGTLIIDAASGDPLEYDDIPQVQKVHALLYHEVFDNPHNPPYDRGQSGRR